jgi:very-short-patch-repair endonuclease
MTPMELLIAMISEDNVKRFNQSRTAQERMMRAFTNERFVGQSLVIAEKLVFYGDFDQRVHIARSSRLASSTLSKIQSKGGQVHYPKSNNKHDTLIPLIPGGNPLCLKCTFEDAFKKKLFTFEELEQKLESKFHGKPLLKAMLPFLEPNFDSVFESLFDLILILGGYVRLHRQVNIANNRADFVFGKVIFELDGMGKYDGKTFNKETIKAIKDEHKRDTNYALNGYRVIHIHWEDLYDGTILRYLDEVGVPKTNQNQPFIKLVEAYIAAHPELEELIPQLQEDPSRYGVFFLDDDWLQ